MSKPIVLVYTAPVSNLVANSQDVVAGARLILNGSSPYTPVPTGPVVFNQLQRPITLSSTTATSNAGVTFVIVGTQLRSLGNASLISENLTGPAGNATVTSVNQYHTIISITATVADATAISAGTGIGAQFDWQVMDFYRTFAQYSVQGVITGGGTVSYSLLQSLHDLSPNSVGAAAFPVDDTIDTPWTSNQFYSFSYPVSILRLVVNATGTNATGNLIFTILQQGVR